MRTNVLFGIILVVFMCFQFVSNQETSFELPVQLVGFPFIVGSVKLTNFLKKLGYSLSPEPFDAQEVEKYIVGEFGTRACVFERVCPI
ncbi:unnamed protein product [Leptidea sinapis]|uniref:Uncharacterized protein n=1 Tax=Leptidea sinapis TaxID=189913 RepID=A0A5E4R3A5_9NEOP|nr:unnamed protein product [Leptidea sinapis]